MDKLLDYFNVKSHRELKDFMKKNPTDERVLELNEILEMFLSEDKSDEK